MNINPSAAAAVAGTSRAAARGGESDNQATEARRQQSVSEKPGGKAADSSEIDAGDQTGDRGGDGRQAMDVFERTEDSNQQSDSQESPPLPQDDPTSPSPDGSGQRLDLQA